MVSHTPQQNQKQDLQKFDMSALRANLPHKRKGLSAYYSGKSQSFTSLADAQCLDDLKKPEIPRAKKIKHSSREDTQQVHAIPCGMITKTTHLAAPFLGF